MFKARQFLGPYNGNRLYLNDKATGQSGQLIRNEQMRKGPVFNSMNERDVRETMAMT